MPHIEAGYTTASWCILKKNEFRDIGNIGKNGRIEEWMLLDIHSAEHREVIEHDYLCASAGVKWLWELHTQRAGGIVGDEMGALKSPSQQIYPYPAILAAFQRHAI